MNDYKRKRAFYLTFKFEIFFHNITFLITDLSNKKKKKSRSAQNQHFSYVGSLKIQHHLARNTMCTIDHLEMTIESSG